MQERSPQIPDTVLEAFFTACQDTPTLRVDQLGDVQGCDSQTAAVAAVFVLPPAPYIPLFDAEDALADLRAQRTAWRGNVKETEATLPPPTVHDTPSPARTYVGTPCSNKQCAPSAQYPSGRPANLRYRRTGLCVACLERLMKERNCW
jgi:hypothetical protein